MSVAGTTRVWRDSNQKGGRLLVLLALADYYNDEQDCAWPSVSRLAKLTRLTPRHVSGVLAELEASEEIQRAGVGRRNVVRWRFTMAPKDCPNGKSKTSTPEKISGVESDDVGEKFIGSPEKISGDPMNPSSDNPLSNIINPYGDDAVAAAERAAPAVTEEGIPANDNWNRKRELILEAFEAKGNGWLIDSLFPENDNGTVLILATATRMMVTLAMDCRAELEAILDREIQIVTRVWASQAAGKISREGCGLNKG